MQVVSVPQALVVAAVQFEPKVLDVAHNLATAQQLAFEASAKGARLVVLPELCTGGAVLRNLDEAADVCQEKDGYQTQAFQAIARRFGCHIVFGYAELCEGKFYNSAAVVGPGGLVGNVQKHNLYGADNLVFQPSEQAPPCFITPVGRLGVLICRDIGNKYRESYVWSRPGQKFYDKGSVDVIACPVNWGSSFGYPDSAWVELVEQTRANVVVANRVGRERDMKYKGGSVVIDRDRRIWTHGSSFTEAAVVGGMVLL
jgi:predicted amidohydrolase